ncbi:MAG: hypothetical protein U1G08_17755 [Verrucomicrobiota bacterium]
MTLTSKLVALGVAGMLAAMVIPAQVCAFNSARRHLGAAWLWSNARVETQLRSMDHDEWEPLYDRTLESLLSDNGESLAKGLRESR